MKSETNLSPQFIEQMKLLLKENAQSFFDSLHTSPPTSIRLNPDKVASTKIPFEKIPWCEHGYYLPKRFSFTTDPFFHLGAYYVQEASSMFLHHILKFLQIENKPKRILDLCASPGGKSTLIASVMHDDSLLVSNETVSSRVGALIQNMMKWGNANVVVTNNDAAAFGKMKNFFDVIVVDAPCSGEGMFRKDDFAVQQWNPNLVLQCEQRQKNILNDVWDALTPGGFLIYSTCTFNKNENEDVLKHFIENNDCTSFEISANQLENISSSFDDKIFADRFFPHKTKGEGFFISVLQKTSSTIVTSEEKKIKKHDFKKHFFSFLSPNFLVAVLNGFTIGVNQLHAEMIANMVSKLNVKKFGVCIGNQVGSEMRYHHHLSMWPQLNNSEFDFLDLNYEDAIKFLRGQTDINCDSGKGWIIARYKNQNLGFAKNLGNRINNYYPKELRIMNPSLQANDQEIVSTFF